MREILVALFASILVACAPDGNQAVPLLPQPVVGEEQLVHFIYVGSNCEHINLTAYVDYTDGRPVTLLFPFMGGRVPSFSEDYSLPAEAYQVDVTVHHVGSLPGSIFNTIYELSPPETTIHLGVLDPGCNEIVTQ